MRIFTIVVKSMLLVMLLVSMAGSLALGQGKCPPYSDGKKYDASPIADAIDANKDGKLTKEEWKKAEAPEPSWNMFMGKENVKKQGYITHQQFLDETPPNGIDTNCDGKITLEEFLATKKWNMGGGGPGGAPGGAPAGGPGGTPPSR